MKTIHLAALSASSALLLTACASSGGMASAPSQYESGHSQEKVVQDAQYVAYVERVARRRGVQVHWIHPPVKRVAVADVDAGSGEQ